MTATTTTNATLIATNPHGQELRHAANQGTTWPGWYAPLGRSGYWVGTDGGHTFVGRSAADARRWWVSIYGGREQDIPLTITEARKMCWNVVRGAYSGTGDNRLDRWYPVRMGILLDRTGGGFRTQREALDHVALVLRLRAEEAGR